MSPTEVLVFVLALLGGEARTLPPIELVPVRPADASPRAEGFRRVGSNTIYLLTTSEVFKTAVRTERWDAQGDAAFIKLASIIIHEAWHVRHGQDERGAYLAQLLTLSRLGAGPGSDVYRGVHKSMLAVLKAQKALAPPSAVDTDLRVALRLPVLAAF